MNHRTPIRIGALVPLTRPGWVQAGEHLLAGLELAVSDINHAGGVAGRPLELVARDTAADPQRAEAAMDEFGRLGVAVVAGEYHSVAAHAAAARAEALQLPFLCSSAVLDMLTEQPTDWVARLAPAQSVGWQVFAEYLLGAGHRRVAAVYQPSLYWETGVEILRNYLVPRGGSLIQIGAQLLDTATLCDELVRQEATAVLLLTGYPEPAASIVKLVRADKRLDAIQIGAPAGQPEFDDWTSSLGDAGASIPFLRYLPAQLTSLGEHVQDALAAKLGGNSSFVAYEGYDTILVLAELLRLRPPGDEQLREIWPSIECEGTRGRIRLSRTSGISVWQWAWPPIQVVDRDPAEPGRFRVLHACSMSTRRQLSGSSENIHATDPRP